MKYILTIEKFSNIIGSKPEKISDIIKRMKLPKELKEDSLNYLTSSTYTKKGKIFGLSLHKDLLKKISEKNLPNGFSMGIDKKGYFIYTHRCRSKSYETPSKITVKSIKFVDSTG